MKNLLLFWMSILALPMFNPNVSFSDNALTLEARGPDRGRGGGGGDRHRPNRPGNGGGGYQPAPRPTPTPRPAPRERDHRDDRRDPRYQPTPPAPRPTPTPTPRERDHRRDNRDYDRDRRHDPRPTPAPRPGDHHRDGRDYRRDNERHRHEHRDDLARHRRQVREHRHEWSRRRGVNYRHVDSRRHDHYYWQDRHYRWHSHCPRPAYVYIHYSWSRPMPAYGSWNYAHVEYVAQNLEELSTRIYDILLDSRADYRLVDAALDLVSASGNYDDAVESSYDWRDSINDLFYLEQQLVRMEDTLRGTSDSFRVENEMRLFRYYVDELLWQYRQNY